MLTIEDAVEALSLSVAGFSIGAGTGRMNEEMLLVALGRRLLLVACAMYRKCEDWLEFLGEGYRRETTSGWKLLFVSKVYRRYFMEIRG